MADGLPQCRARWLHVKMISRRRTKVRRAPPVRLFHLNLLPPFPPLAAHMSLVESIVKFRLLPGPSRTSQPGADPHRDLATEAEA